MKNVAAYIIVCSFLFALLDWKVVHLTRIANRDWLDWMHAHERHYALATRIPETILCTPCMALKPVFYYAIVSAQASQEEQDAVLHAPKMSWRGFYHLPVRGESWTFVPWLAWFAYWLPLSVIWWLVARRFFSK